MGVRGVWHKMYYNNLNFKNFRIFQWNLFSSFLLSYCTALPLDRIRSVNLNLFRWFSDHIHCGDDPSLRPVMWIIMIQVQVLYVSQYYVLYSARKLNHNPYCRFVHHSSLIIHQLWILFHWLLSWGMIQFILILFNYYFGDDSAPAVLKRWSTDFYRIQIFHYKLQIPQGSLVYTSYT